ncbi:unnamed protein product [Blumeria hordei]|uniref:Mitochondrial inner membrane protease ATP23 n=2 Tax=Blumeria hordei TaxID=2867405 RepID=A0A383V288_BLUHO|nr:protease atp-23/Mitochondrial inner membrane protease atp23 [Blumeria hordei DH14]SZF06106.1 unnamed protein product [Blumeria hordei]
MSQPRDDNSPKLDLGGYDAKASWWSNYWKFFTGRMSYSGQVEWSQDLSRKNEKADCKRCDEYRDWCFKYSPTIIFMKKNIEALNGEVNEDTVRCRRCPAWKDEEGNWRRQSGGFTPDHGILICANELQDRKHLEDTLAHEMIHAWDHLRWKINWMDLRHNACTEIRASSLSGECRWSREFFKRNNWTITEQHQECVRKRAVMSMLSRCKDESQASSLVDEVWDSCFNDTRPFDEIYR